LKISFIHCEIYLSFIWIEREGGITGEKRRRWGGRDKDTKIESESETNKKERGKWVVNVAEREER